MSGCSYTSCCPNCGSEDMKCYSDYKPYDIQDNVCLNCGFYAYTNQGYMSLAELNVARAEEELEPLKELPLQEKV